MLNVAFNHFTSFPIQRTYYEEANSFLYYILQERTTPQGLLWTPGSQWGSTKQAVNYAHFAMQAYR